MSTQDTLVRDLLGVIDARNWAELAALVTPDIVYDRPGYRTMCGHAEFVEFYTRVREVAEGRHQLDSLLTDERTGFCWGHFQGTTRDGRPVAELFADWYQFEGARISKRRTFFYRPAI